jgi:hypothetical protein
MQVVLLQVVIRKNCHDVKLAYKVGTKRRIESKNNRGKKWKIVSSQY